MTGAGRASRPARRTRARTRRRKERPPETLALAAADPLPLAARKILARQAFLISRRVEGTLAGRDAEELHDLRVATRRARAALRLMGAALPADRVSFWRDELRWLGKLSGAARDADVFSERVRRHLAELQVGAAARREILALLASDRRNARRQLAEALRSERFERLVAELSALPQGFHTDGTEQGAEGSARALAPALVARELRRLRRWRHRRIELLSAEELHAVRIAGKRGRYALEFFAAVLGPGFEEPIRSFVALQDCLGAHQDAVVARDRLAAAARRLKAAGAGAETLAAVETLMRRERELAAERRLELATLAPELFRLARRLARELSH